VGDRGGEMGLPNERYWDEIHSYKKRIAELEAELLEVYQEIVKRGVLNLEAERDWILKRIAQLEER